MMARVLTDILFIVDGFKCVVEGVVFNPAHSVLIALSGGYLGAVAKYTMRRTPTTKILIYAQ